MQRASKVLISHPEVPKAALDLLRSHGIQPIVCQQVPPVRAEIIEKIRGVDGLLWAHCDHLNAEIIDASGGTLKAVSSLFSGIDCIDVDEFKRRQLPLGHTPGVVRNAVADLAIGLMIAAGRNFHAGRQEIETSSWQTDRIDWLMGQEIRDSVIGFFGFGGIGQGIAERLQSWHVADIIYNTRTRKPNDAELHATHVTFEKLLSDSDFLIAAAPLTKETSGIFNASAFKRMKRNCVFVNVARGGLVDQQALYEALKSGEIFAAGLDVMTPEPLPANDPILKLPNVWCCLIWVLRQQGQLLKWP